MEAKVLMLRCETHKRPFGVRVQKEGNDWLLTWAFEIDEHIAAKEGFSSQSTLKGKFIITEDYPGCPHCGSTGFFTCGNCGKVSCWSGSEVTKCSWCSNKSKVRIASNFEIEGGGF